MIGTGNDRDQDWDQSSGPGQGLVLVPVPRYSLPLMAGGPEVLSTFFVSIQFFSFKKISSPRLFPKYDYILLWAATKATGHCGRLVFAIIETGSVRTKHWNVRDRSSSVGNLCWGYARLDCFSIGISIGISMFVPLVFLLVFQCLHHWYFYWYFDVCTIGISITSATFMLYLFGN